MGGSTTEGSEPGDSLRVLVADDHPLFRSGLRTLLGTDPRMQLVGEVGTGNEAVALALELRPDVVVLDLHMPGLDGIEAARQIHAQAPDLAILALTMSDDDTDLVTALHAGVRGYLVKQAGPAEILAAIVSVARGATVLGSAVALTNVLADVPSNPDSVFSKLTRREREVLDLVAQGRTNPAIAHCLKLSPKTVANHVTNIFTKIDVQTRAEAIVRARQAGLGRLDGLGGLGA